MARDEFTKQVINALRLRVAARCSNPGCRRPTSGPADGPVAVSSVGVAAHIHAAAAGGPRYLAKMTREQRRAIGNAIWLCGICATKVDRDVVKFPAELLLKWKQLAEQQAAEEQGRRLPAASDAVNQLVMALTGEPRGLFQQAIANTHSAVVASMEAIDPRFRVQSRFDNGRTYFELTPLEPIDVKVAVDAELAAAWMEGMERLFSHAEPVALPLAGAVVHGSPLFAAIQNEDRGTGSLRIEPPSQKLVAKIAVPAGDGGLCVDELPGVLYVVPSLLRFEGHGYAGLLRLKMRLTRVGKDVLHADLSIHPVFDVWKGRDVTRLPFRERLAALFRGMADKSDRVRIDFEIDGTSIISASAADVLRPTDTTTTLNYLAYVERARRIAHYTGASICIAGTFTAEDHHALADAVDTFEGVRVLNAAEVKSDPQMTFVLGAEQAAEFEAMDCKFDEFVWVQDPETISVFGTLVQLPALEIQVTGKRPRILSSEDVEGGRQFEVCWLRSDGFRWEFTYVDEARNPIRPEVLPH